MISRTPLLFKVTAILFLLLCVVATSVAAQEPTLLGRIQSDTMGVLFGRHIMSLGDQNGDGYSDIMVSDTRFSTHVYFGGITVDSISDFMFMNAGRAAHLEDIDGDSVDDYSMRLGTYGTYSRGIYYGGVPMDTTPGKRLGDQALYGYGPTSRARELTGVGSDVLVSTGNDFWRICIYEIGPGSDTVVDYLLTPPGLSSSDFAFGEGLTTGDFNGDGYDDLAVTVRSFDDLVGRFYLYWGGPGFDTTPDLIIKRPGPFTSDTEYFGRLLVNLGDFNDDGWDDIYAGGRASDDSLSFLYWGGPGIDTIPDMVIVGDRERAASAGDINHDGHPDLIIGRPSSWSGLGWVYLYYGGPDADSLPDFELYVGDIPGLKVEFGMDVAGIGDFNGDGIDDFAFSCVHSVSVGTVYIFTGFDGNTDVGDSDSGGGLPGGYELRQNYPNPFNPSTTIQFSLPEKTTVSVCIYNSLGQHVNTLLNETLPAGEHSVIWGGRDSNGVDCASGVYYYEMQAEHFTDSRKMILMR